jgi:hypothetical protein
MSLSQPEPYARLSLRDRLELLAFEARLAGLPESLIQAVWEVIESTSRMRLEARGVRAVSAVPGFG